MKNLGWLFFLILGCTLTNSEDNLPDMQTETLVVSPYDSLLEVLKTKWNIQAELLEDEHVHSDYFNTSADLVAHYLLALDTLAASTILETVEKHTLDTAYKLPEKILFQKGYYYIFTKQFDEAISIFQAFNEAKQEANTLALIGLGKTYIERCKNGYNVPDIDTAFVYFRDAESRKLSKGLRQKLQVYLADSHMRMLQLDSVYHILTRVLNEKNIAQNTAYEAHYYLNEWADRVENHAALYEHAKGLLTYGEQIFPSTSRPMARCYLKVSYAAERVGEIEKAIAYAEKANAINKKFGNTKAYLYNLSNLCNSYQRLENTTQALSCYQEALQIAYQQKNIYAIYSLHNDLGMLYNRLEQIDSAKYHHQRSLDLRIKNLGIQHKFVARSRLGLAQTYLAEKDFLAARQQLQLALDVFQKEADKNRILIADAYQQQAHLEHQQSNYQAALAYQQQALWQLHPSYDTTNLANLVNLNKPSISELKLLSVLGKKAKQLQLLYEQTRDSSYFQAAANAFENAFDLIDKLRNGVEDKASKNYLNAYHIYNDALQHKFFKYNLTPSTKLLTEAFDIAEKSKSILLKERVKDSYAKLEANIAQDDLKEERRLKKAIAKVEKQLFEAELKTDTSRLEVLASEHFELKREYEKFIQNLKETYPQYYDLKYKLNTLSLSDTQALLPDEETALLEYVVSDSSVYAFVVQKKSVQAIEIKRTFPLRKWINQMRESIVTNHVNKNRSEVQELAYLDTLTQTAHALHQKLIAPLESKQALPQKLIIIPNGVLGYLPFEALLEELPSDKSLLGTYAYMIKKHQISYAFSATLLSEMKQKESPEYTRNFLAFAPDFPDRYSNFPPLAYNVLEANRIKSLLGGELIKAAAASKSNFITQVTSTKILHLATHGKANEEVGDYAYLAFSPADKDFLLYNREIYALQIPAEMVVLSACETGIGELQVGEGIISLARGFSYAGAKSIITSLWSVNDQKTQELMVSFYTYIKEGMTKDAALRQAKLDFIDKYFHEAYPFYWASFIPIGDMTPISLNSWWQ